MAAASRSKGDRCNIHDIDVRHKEIPDAAETRGGGGAPTPDSAGGGRLSDVASPAISSIWRVLDAGWPVIWGFLRGMAMILPVALQNPYPPEISIRAIVGDRKMGTIRDQEHVSSY